MLNRERLARMYRDLRDRKVLSVYLDASGGDFADKGTWRRRLENEVSVAREAMETNEPEDARAFASALERIHAALGEMGNFLPDRGWVGFATEGRLVHGAPVPVPMPDLVRWELGIRVAPYVRGLKQDRVVVGVLVDSRRARVFEYRHGMLEEPIDLVAETGLGDLTDETMSKRASGHSGIRGETATDAAQRLLHVESERMVKELVEVAAGRAGAAGLLVIGGTPEAVAQAARHLPSSLDGRSIQRPSMSLEMADSEIVAGLEEASSELNRSLQRGLLDQVIDQERSAGRGALGPDDVETALREGRVDTLLLTRTYVAEAGDHADHLVGAAFDQGAEVEELSFEGAERLDAEGRGVGARLRYVFAA